MKITKSILLASLLTAGLSADVLFATDITPEVKSEAVEKKLKTITTKGKYRKPGAPIDMTHTEARVAVGEVAEIDVTFSTSLRSGSIELEVTLDEGLESVEHLSSVTSFHLVENKKEYEMKFNVSAKKDGLYYIRLLGKAGEGESIRMRSFAIPVYVGDGQLKKKGKQQIMKVMGGENLSISKAEETIEYAK
ncbi:MAG: hypothetical protein KAG56_05080 [Sulfurovaceae bacterium]|nr:hypothetical protein [Sulfurovaceae bacterium]